MKNFFKQHIVWFIIYAVLVSCAAAFVMHRADTKLKESQSLIIANQNKSVAIMDSLMTVRNALACDSIKYKTLHLKQLCDNLGDAIKTLDAQQNNNRIVGLLELEFSKIQSEYDVLNLWCALLTVVFLIFSFFSIFKTNEMSNQSEAALENMRNTENKVRDKSDELDKNIKNAEDRISNVKNSIDNEEKRNKELSSQIDSLKKDELEVLKKKISKESENQIDLEERKKAFKDDLTMFKEELKSKFSEELSKQISGLTELISQRTSDEWDSKNKNLLDKLSILESDIKSKSQIVDDLKRRIFGHDCQGNVIDNEGEFVDESEEGLSDEDITANEDDEK